MRTAHYTEGVHLICEQEADKQSCSKDSEEFGWLMDICTKKNLKPADCQRSLQLPCLEQRHKQQWFHLLQAPLHFYERLT